MDKLLENHPLCVEEIMNLGIQTNGQELDSTDLQIIFNFESFFYEGLTGKEFYRVFTGFLSLGLLGRQI
jgi:hypothetical protein